MLAGDHELHTGTIVIIVDGDQRNMLTERGANAALEPDAVHDSILEGASVVHFTGYSLFGRDSTVGFKRLIKRARSLGVQVSVDAGSAGFLADFGGAKFLDAIAGAQLLFPSIEEGKVLTGLTDPVEIAEKLAKKFPVVVLTQGRGGVIVAANGEVLDLDVTQTNPVDPTGAGDAFCAGFLSDWIVSANYRSAAMAGASLAAKAVGVIGGRPPV
jgi:sugar/nucleoside kinase (ribokinase family)